MDNSPNAPQGYALCIQSGNFAATVHIRVLNAVDIHYVSFWQHTGNNQWQCLAQVDVHRYYLVLFPTPTYESLISQLLKAFIDMPDLDDDPRYKETIAGAQAILEKIG